MAWSNLVNHFLIRCWLFILTLNMLNCLKDYKRSIHILNHILDLAWPKWLKLTLEQKYMLSVLYSQYHACWCSGDFRSQGIRHGMDPQSQNIPSPASEELTYWPLGVQQWFYFYLFIFCFIDSCYRLIWYPGKLLSCECLCNRTHSW